MQIHNMRYKCLELLRSTKFWCKVQNFKMVGGGGLVVGRFTRLYLGLVYGGFKVLQGTLYHGAGLAWGIT